MSEKGKKNQKKSGLGLAIWILALLIVLIIFLVKADEIKSNLKETRFFERIFGSAPAFIVETPSKPKVEVETGETIIELKKTVKEPVKVEKEEKKEPVEQKIVKSVPEVKKEAEKTVQVKEEVKTEKPVEKVKLPEIQKPEVKKETEPVKTEKKVVEQTPAPAPTVKTKICFVSIDMDGPIVRKEVTRSVLKDSPLTYSLKSLLEGPTAGEENTGCKTLIPTGTKLYSVSVKNGVAVLNFSEEFEFNQYGVEGFLGQLMQIVYTATSFNTVQSVQILIEGNKKEYLGSEGVWIGSPLSRASFR